MDNNYKKDVDLSKIDAKNTLVKHVPYLWPKELEFYEMYASLLPKEYIIVSKVGVDKIVKPRGSLVMYNAIKNKYVDFCVFKRSTMEAVVVLDCYYPSIVDSTSKELPPAVSKALAAVGVPVIKFEILDIPYDKDKVLQQFYDALDPVSLAQLKKQK